jgi:hypothetical protein
MAGRPDQYDQTFADLDQQFAGVGYLGQVRDWYKFVHGIRDQLANHVPPSIRNKATIKRGSPSFSELAERRRSSIRPETTMRNPPADHHNAGTAMSKPRKRTMLATASRAVTVRPVP